MQVPQSVSIERKMPHHKAKALAKEFLRSDNCKLYVKAFLIYTAITLLLYWYIAISMWNTVPNGGGDVYQSLWSLWWVPASIFAMHVTPYFSHLVYFPIGANLITETLMPLAGILTYPLQLVSLPFAYNSILLLGFILSGLFTFMLIFYLTKNKYASFIGGLVFAFSPMHIAQAVGHLNWASIEFVPLFVLMLLMMIREKKMRYMIGASIAFVLVNFFGDLLQGIEVVLFIILLIAIYLISKERKEILNAEFAKLFAGFIILALILGSPFLVPIISGMLQPGTLSTAVQLSDIPHNLLWSNNLVSFFVPSYYNQQLNQFASSHMQALYGLAYQGVIYNTDVNEKISYLGYSVILLMLLAIYFDFKNSKLRKILPWIIIGAIFAWLSLGPYVQTMGTVTGIPTIYALYRHVPLFNLIREPGRFDLMATLCFAIIAAIGFDYLSKKTTARNVFALAIIFSIVIIFEYVGFPVSGATIGSMRMNASVPIAYSQIGQLKGNFSVLMLPALMNTSSQSPELYPGLEMYYQAAMKGKAIIGGYTSRFNISQYNSVDSIPLAASAGYLQAGEGFIYPSPIISNSSNTTLLWLAMYNVKFVSLIRSAYNLTDQAVLYNYLYGVFGSPVYSDNTTFVFSTSNAVLGRAGKSLVAYTAGTWIPGYSFCSQYCNSTIASTWWGSNVRGMGIYSPNAIRVNVSMEAISYLNDTPLYVYMNNSATYGTKAVGKIGLNSTFSKYAFTLNLTSGFNQVIFYTQNSTAVPSSYLLFGAKNITVTQIPK